MQRPSLSMARAVGHRCRGPGRDCAHRRSREVDRIGRRFRFAATPAPVRASGRARNSRVTASHLRARAARRRRKPRRPRRPRARVPLIGPQPDGRHARHGAARDPGLFRVAQWRGTGLLTTNFAEAGAFLRTPEGLERPDVQLHFVIGLVDDHARTPALRLRHDLPCRGASTEEPRDRVGLRSAEPARSAAHRPELPCGRRRTSRPCSRASSVRATSWRAPRSRRTGAQSSLRRRATRRSPGWAHPAARGHHLSSCRHLPHGRRCIVRRRPGACACAGSRDFRSSTHPSCRRSSAATPTRRRHDRGKGRDPLRRN